MDEDFLVPEFYLVTTDHLEKTIWFREDEDFEAGMNLTALLSNALHVVVTAFILMSNHVHFILESDYRNAQRFIFEFKRRYSIRMRLKYGIKEMLRDNGIYIQEVLLGNESLERAIAYVQMNSVAANICLQASDYPWGSGNAFFRFNRSEGTLLSSLSARKKFELLHTRADLPGKYVLIDNKYIDPASYVNVRFVESLFRTPRRMNHFLINSSKAKIRLSSEGDSLPAFKDQLVASAIPDLCRTLFQKNSIKELDEKQLCELLKQLRFRFSSNVNQLCRVSGIPYSDVVRLLDS